MKIEMNRYGPDELLPQRLGSELFTSLHALVVSETPLPDGIKVTTDTEARDPTRATGVLTHVVSVAYPDRTYNVSPPAEVAVVVTRAADEPYHVMTYHARMCGEGRTWPGVDVAARGDFWDGHPTTWQEYMPLARLLKPLIEG